LCIDNVFINEGGFLALFPVVPTVRTLILRDLRLNTLTDKVMYALTCGTTSAVLPTLTNLSLSGSYLFRNHSLLAMLESRISATSCRIQRVNLHLKHRQFGAEELDRLRALVSNGVALSVKSLNADKQYVTLM
jgi:hypothetical protein